MMRALSAGVQGLRAHQIRMDVIGNNIANVNTTGFKASRVMFGEMYSQTVAGATSPSTARGGVNPKQVGLGVGVASIDTLMEPGSLQLTGRATDLAIQGAGFFVLRDGGRFLYTRAGGFDFDSQGFLVNPATGQRVQGWMPDKTTGNFPTRELSTMEDIQLPVADSVLASPTTGITFDQSLNAAAPVGTTHPAAITVIDSLGIEHTLNLEFEKVADNAWDVRVLTLDAAGNPITLTQTAYPTWTTPPGAPAGDDGRLQFTNTGALEDNDADPLTPFIITMDYADPGGGAAAITVDLDFTRVIQPALLNNTDNTSTLRMLEYNGYPTGSLERIFVDNRGVVTGYYTNGQYREVAQVAVASFFNPAGLMKDGNNNWVESPNSGLALIGAAGDGGRGTIASSNLEMSNVDISAEFTNMIITQRGFQANSRIITASDEMLQEVVNLKR